MTTDTRPIRAVLIAGPTASGKSRLALALARRVGGAVVNADASQVYRDLRVLTARPTNAEEREAPHVLYGHVDAAEPYAVGRWLEDVHRFGTGSDLASEQNGGDDAAKVALTSTPIFVGGTGFYFDALTNGLATVPAIPDEIRARWRALGSTAALHAELARRDPVMAARLRPSDPQRLTRALEVIDATGRSLADWQADATRGLVDPADALRIVIAPDRAALDGAIVRRLHAMLEEGGAEEAQRLVARGLDPALPALKALGVAPLAAWRRGALGRDEAIERTRLDTRRYAKRQSTWFRNRMADWLHLAPEVALETAVAEISRRGLARG